MKNLEKDNNLSALEVEVMEVKLDKKIQNNKNYLPFGVNYMEIPEPIISSKINKDFYNITSVTFCTFKKIPLVDDAD